jgi:uncharacterized protein Usg
MAAAGGYLLTRPMSSPQPLDRKATIRAVYAPNAPRPQLSPLHLTLMRRLRVMWVPVEEGAPGIDVGRPLLGEGPTVPEAMSVLNTTDEALAIRALAESGLLIHTFVQSGGTLAPGRYAVPQEMRKFFDFPESGVDASGGFELRKEHLTLLKAAQWRVVDSEIIDEVLDEEIETWPMPYVDGKRPYGDRSFYQIDMAELLGQPYRLDRRGNVIRDEKKDARLERLHMETLAALQVFLCHATSVGQA